MQQLTDELLDLCIEDAEEDAREPPMESSLERVEREKSIQHTPIAAFKIVGDNIDKKGVQAQSKLHKILTVICVL